MNPDFTTSDLLIQVDTITADAPLRVRRNTTIDRSMFCGACTPHSAQDRPQ